MSKYTLKRQCFCDFSLADCVFCPFCCGTQFCTLDMDGAYYTLIFKMFTLKREQKDGVVGPVARTVLKIIHFALYSVADLLHNLG